MADLLASFKKDIGDNTSPEATTVGMDFGRHLGTLRGEAPNSSLSRTIINGGHEYSNTVLNSYAVSGQAVPDEVKGLISELNNLAQHSNSVAQMDELTRIRMIGKGHKALDEKYILAREGELLSQIENLSRGVLTEEDRLNRQKLRAVVTQNEQQVIENNLSLEASALTLADTKEARTYSKMLDELSAEEIERGLNDGEISKLGIPRGYAVNYLANRYTELGKIEEKKRAVTPKNDPFFNITNNAFGTRSADLALVADPDILALGLEQYQQGLQDGTIEPSPIPQLTIPGFGDIKFSLNEVQEALNIGLETANKLGDSLGDREKLAGLIEQKSNLFSSSKLMHENTLSSIVFGLGIAPGVDSPLLTEVNSKFDDYRENMLNAASSSEIQSLTTNFQSYLSGVKDKQIKSMPKDRQAAARDIFEFGKITSHEASDSVLDDAMSRPTEFNRSIVEKEPYRETGKLISLVLAAELANGEEEDIIKALASDGDKDDRTLGVKLLNDEVFVEQLSDVFAGELLEHAYARNINAVLDEMAAQFEGVDDPIALKSLEQINKVRKEIFGNNTNAEFSPENNMLLYNTPGVEPKVLLDETGEPRLDREGNPIRILAMNFDALYDKLAVESIRLQEAGVENNLVRDSLRIKAIVKQEVVQTATPSNIIQHGMAYKFFAAYQGNSDGLSHSVPMIVDQTLVQAERYFQDRYQSEQINIADRNVEDLANVSSTGIEQGLLAYRRFLQGDKERLSLKEREDIESKLKDATPAFLVNNGFISRSELLEGEIDTMLDGGEVRPNRGGRGRGN